MKNKLKALLITFAFTVLLGSLLTVIVEYTMHLNTEKSIKLAEMESKRQDDINESLNAEEIYQREMLLKALGDYDTVSDYYNGLALVKKNNKYGYIDRNGEEVIPVQYDTANDFIRKYAKAEKDEKWGYIDVNGNIIIPIEYEYCGDVAYGVVAVGNEGKYGFVSIEGNPICDLIYDKVEAFDAQGLAKVVIDQKYGYIDKNGNVKVDITTPYVEENRDFTGEWKQTDVHSQKASLIVISNQTATSFDFEISAKYFSKKGTVSGSASIVKPNVAEYYYRKGQTIDKVIFSFTDTDGSLVVDVANDSNLGLDKEISVVGTYTLKAPKYTNENVMDRLFGNNEKLLQRIKNALGSKIYDEYFLYGFKNGEYTFKELDGKDDVIKGDVYTVTVPTLSKDFKLLISKNNVYFYAKQGEIYKTDDENRKSLGKMPSAIAFDEL